MLPLAADENFNHDVVRAVRRRVPGIDILTVQEAGLAGEEDPVILAWAALRNVCGNSTVRGAACPQKDPLHQA